MSADTESAKVKNGYILATGAAEVRRLKLLNELYGPSSERLLWQAGLTEGMQVVDIGCGSGNITRWLARQVGETGSVLGLDASPEQIEQARLLTDKAGLTNITFVVADAYNPRLPLNSFDLVYSRLVLMHLTRPLDALKQMQALLKPGGRLVCEEMDITYTICHPASDAFTRLRELNLALGDCRGQHFRLGTSLEQLFLEIGLSQPKVSINMPVALQGESKQLIALSFAQFAPALIQEGLSTQTEIDQLFATLQQLTEDPTILFGMPLVGQVVAHSF